MEPIKSAYYRYIDKAEGIMREAPRKANVSGTGTDPKTRQFERLVYECETSEEFSSLVIVCAKHIFAPSRPLFPHWLRLELSHFLISSGLYVAIRDAGNVDRNDHYSSLAIFLNTLEGVQTLLLPLHGIDFPERRFELGKYLIRRFSLDEMEEMIIFAPHVPDRDRVAALQIVSKYWYLEVSDPVRKSAPISPVVDAGRSGGVRFVDHDSVYLDEPGEYVPRQVEFTLKLLSLLKWPDPIWPVEWFRFTASGKPSNHIPFHHFPIIRIPFVLHLSNWRGSCPRNLEGTLQRLFDEEEIDSYYDASDREPYGSAQPEEYYPMTHVHISDFAPLAELTELWSAFHEVASSTHLEIGFVRRALDFLFLGAAKGHHADAFLANMMCLEALFGIKEGTISAISAGLAHVYASSDTNGRGECQYFKKHLYEGRSRLIHGDISPNELNTEWGTVTRVMARESVAWTLKRLREVDVILQDSSTPTKFGREQFLMILRIPPCDLSLHRMIIGRVP